MISQFYNNASSTFQVVPVVAGTATKIVSAKAAAITGIGSTLLKATPILGPAAIGIG